MDRSPGDFESPASASSAIRARETYYRPIPRGWDVLFPRCGARRSTYVMQVTAMRALQYEIERILTAARLRSRSKGAAWLSS